MVLARLKRPDLYYRLSLIWLALLFGGLIYALLEFVH